MNILLLILMVFFKINCYKEYNEISDNLGNIYNHTLEIGLSQTYSIEFKKSTSFFFKISDDNPYQINIHSINCNLDVFFSGEIMNQINLDTYSLKINKTCNYIIIKPLIDIIDGKEKENYESRKCFLSINSINLTQPTVKIENQDDSIFYFDSTDLNLLDISYELKELSNNSFAALSFQLNDNSNFSIDVIYNNGLTQKNKISKNIYNSTYILLNSDFLNQDSIENSNLILNIIIHKNDNKAVKMSFKIIEKEMTSILQKDALNYGFIITEIKHQYYYFEVFYGEEGEIMLHNKRFYGELIAKIMTKDEINETDLKDSSKYPKNEDGNINYNPHSLKLMYNYDNTKNCLEGCYMLITYEQKQSVGEYPNIGYEFTLLSRSWNYSDFISPIVDIPFNEYLLGFFEKNSITHHYYSIYIPEDADKIIIQLEGNYIDLFYGEGRKKINTMNIRGNDKDLEIFNNENVITLDKSEYNFSGKAISFAIRPKDYFVDIFSFYYFRILYVKEGGIIYFPLDSQLGNLCSPEYDDQTKKYNCHFMFSNNYNELNTNFTISSYNLNEYFKINVIMISKNGTTYNEEKEAFYLYHNNKASNNIDYFLFTIEFRNSEIKNIISALRESIRNYYPHIYSSQMFYLIGFNKTCFFRVKNKYTLIYKYIYTNPYYYSGWVGLSFLDFKTFESHRNVRGKQFALDIDSNINQIYYNVNGVAEYLFVFKLEYIMRNKGIIEIKSGETRSQFMQSGHFPLYYYFKIKHQDYISLSVNLRLNSYDDSIMKNNFDIKGYLLDENIIKRKINGEYIELHNPINGTYSNKFKVGLIEVNQNNTLKYNYSYVLIEIINLNSADINSNLLVEIMVKEYYEDIYFMPINQYMIETFNGANGTIRTENKYHIFVDQREDSQVFIDLSPEFNDIDLIFYNETYPEGFYCSDFNCKIKPMTGFRKYIIDKYNNNNIYFNIINRHNRSANYMIRFSYGKERDAYYYYLQDNPERKFIEENNEYISLSLSFNPIEVLDYSNLIPNLDYAIYFYISGLLYKKNETSQELVNTTSFPQERIASYEEHLINVYNKTHKEKLTFTFKNIPRKENYIYDLQIQANAFLLKNLFNEEFLVFTKEIDLTDIKLEEKKDYLWYALGPVLGFIGLLLIVFFVIKYIRLQKANMNLKEEIKSIAYSSDIKQNVLKKEKIESKKDSDFETTFI